MKLDLRTKAFSKRIDAQKRERFTLMCGDSVRVLAKLNPNQFDSIVTDPPYGLSFMGKKWDYDVPSVEIWKECLRVLKPGGHLLAFGGTRTYHRLVVAIEDAGFEIRDQIQWIYGQGFSKSQNIAKALTKADGAPNRVDQFEGLGTALKPANEPICLARKPLSEKTVAKNVLRHGTGGMNIDGTRIEYVSEADKQKNVEGLTRFNSTSGNSGSFMASKEIKPNLEKTTLGRFPANVIFDEDAAAVLDGQTGITKSDAGLRKGNKAGTKFGQVKVSDRTTGYTDAGGASRFFYVAKASKSDRGEGNTHPTVKPVKLMEYLVKLVTPEGGTVLDPFMGSGTTGVAAIKNEFYFYGVDQSREFFELAQKRLLGVYSLSEKKLIRLNK